MDCKESQKSIEDEGIGQSKELSSSEEISLRTKDSNNNILQCNDPEPASTNTRTMQADLAQIDARITCPYALNEVLLLFLLLLFLNVA
jgi:hypothetical protein